MLAERNDPCPCGSGRKYKKCCMPGAVDPMPAGGRMPASGEADPYATLRDIETLLAARLVRFADGRFGEDIYLDALVEFDPEDERLESEETEPQLFFPWFLYGWRDPLLAAPAARRAGSLPRRAAPPTIAEAFLTARRHQVDAADRDFIERTCAQPFSFHEVIHREPGKGLWLRDVLLDVEHDVTELSASISAGKGDILFTRVVSFDGCALLVGLGATPLPPIEKLQVLALGKELRSSHGAISADLLHARASDLRDLYIDARTRLWYPLPLDDNPEERSPSSLHERCTTSRPSGRTP